jgi:hypothetical protein
VPERYGRQTRLYTVYKMEYGAIRNYENEYRVHTSTAKPTGHEAVGLRIDKFLRSLLISKKIEQLLHKRPNMHPNSRVGLTSRYSYIASFHFHDSRERSIHDIHE